MLVTGVLASLHCDCFDFCTQSLNVLHLKIKHADYACSLLRMEGHNNVVDVAFYTKEWFQSHHSNIIKALIETHGTMNDVSDLVSGRCKGTYGTIVRGGIHLSIVYFSLWPFMCSLLSASHMPFCGPLQRKVMT